MQQARRSFPSLALSPRRHNLLRAQQAGMLGDGDTLLNAAQDGQEFSKLLLTLLETKLANSSNPVRSSRLCEHMLLSGVHSASWILSCDQGS